MQRGFQCDLLGESGATVFGFCHELRCFRSKPREWPQTRQSPEVARESGGDRRVGRLVAVVETTLSNLAATETLTLGSLDVFVDITAHCTDCETHKTVFQSLGDGGCECNTDR